VNVNTNDPDFLDARLFPSVVLDVAPAVTMDEASSLSERTAVFEITQTEEGRTKGCDHQPRVLVA